MASCELADNSRRGRRIGTQRGRPGGAAFVALTVETRTTSLLPEPGLLNDVEIRLSRLEYGEYLVGVEDVRFDELTPLELGA